MTEWGTQGRGGCCRRAITVLAPLCAAVLPLSAAVTRAEIIDAMPDVIVCSVKDPTGMLSWDRLVYYVSAHMTSGDTLFKTLTSDPVVLLVSDAGIVKGPNLADCDGRSIESLRGEGRAFDITGAPGSTHPPG